MVGRGDLLQGLALMSLLAARRLVRWSAQALGPGGARRFFEPVARRRLAAVRTVQPEPPLKLGDPRLQSRDLRRLRRDQRNQLFTRRLALRIRIRTHRILESKADSAVEKNLPAQPPRHATINLGSYNSVSLTHSPFSVWVLEFFNTESPTWPPCARRFFKNNPSCVSQRLAMLLGWLVPLTP